jgi:ABC-2 type transport system permease protein
MRTLALLVWKDARLLFNDRTALAISFIVPMVLILVFGMVLGGSGDGPSGIRLLVVDQSGTTASARLVAALEREDAFRVIRSRATEEGPVPLTEADARQLLESNASAYRFAVILPPDFTGEGIGFNLRFLYNPQNPMENAMVTGLFQRAFFTEVPGLLLGRLDDTLGELRGGEGWQAFRDNLGLFALDVFGVDPEDAVAGFEAFVDSLREQGGDALFAGSVGGEEGDLLDGFLNIDAEQVFGRGRNIATQSMAGFASMFLLFGLSAVATSFFEDRNQQILHRLLAGPVSRIQILFGKYIFCMLLGCAQLAVLFAFGHLVFDVFHSPAQVPLVGILMLALSAAATGFGMLICAFTRTAAQASGFATLLILLMSALGGAMIPSFLFPSFLRDYIAPLTLVHWGVDGFLAVLWRDAGLAGILPYVGILLLVAAAALAVATPRFLRDATFTR